MKKIAILLLFAVAVSSCSLFKKPSMTQEEIDALVQEKAQVQEELANLKADYDRLKIQANECQQMLEMQAAEAEATPAGNYYVITGSFKNSQYADDYAAEMKNIGGIGEIIQGPWDFNLVAYSAYSTLKEAIDGMYTARAEITDDAWVYMLK